MTYKLFTTTEDGVKIYEHISEDGLTRITCTEDNTEYQAWLNPETTQPIGGNK